MFLDTILPCATAHLRPSQRRNSAPLAPWLPLHLPSPPRPDPRAHPSHPGTIPSSHIDVNLIIRLGRGCRRKVTFSPKQMSLTAPSFHVRRRYPPPPWSRSHHRAPNSCTNALIRLNGHWPTASFLGTTLAHDIRERLSQAMMVVTHRRLLRSREPVADLDLRHVLLRSSPGLPGVALLAPSSHDSTHAPTTRLKVSLLLPGSLLTRRLFPLQYPRWLQCLLAQARRLTFLLPLRSYNASALFASGPPTTAM